MMSPDFGPQEIKIIVNIIQEFRLKKMTELFNELV